MADTNGGPGRLSTGSFGGSHTYADNGVYTVTVTIFDDDGGSDVKTYVITVKNDAPKLAVTPSTTSSVEGQQISFAATFSDPGFDNHDEHGPGPEWRSTETAESFSYSINWGDGREAINGQSGGGYERRPGRLSTGSFGGSHTYADNGVYTVTVTIVDDDGGSDVKTYTVTVANVAPTLDGGGRSSVQRRRPACRSRIGRLRIRASTIR